MSKQVKIGNVIIGGENKKIAIQSMTTSRPSDLKNSINDILKLQNAGCDIVRFAVPSEEDALAIKEIKKEVNVPLVADIHFDYRLAVKSIENGADKIRINPGNIGSDDKIKIVADAIKEYGIPVRVGSNTGSIEKEFLKKYGKNEISLVESALKNVRILEEKGVDNIVISVKASSVPLMVKAYRYLSERTNYPLHLGVTEAGTLINGIIKNSAGIGSLLLDGIGDTIRISLTADPVEEVYAAKKLLKALELDKSGVEIVSCPTCGRCCWDLINFAKEVEDKTQNIQQNIKLAVMGCVVNGPGEAADADLGIAGAKDGFALFKKGKPFKSCSIDTGKQEFFNELQNILNEKKGILSFDKDSTR